MKPVFRNKASSKQKGYQSDDENVRYKINTAYINKIGKSPVNAKKAEVFNNDDDDDDTVRYKFPTVLNRSKSKEQKPKQKSKIKVNFWSNKKISRLNNAETKTHNMNRRHTIAATANDTTTAKPKNPVMKVRKQVSFLPSPVFSDEHVPMVTVPDDLTIQLNEDEVNYMAADLLNSYMNQNQLLTDKPESLKKKRNHHNSQEAKRKCILDDSNVKTQANENELEFFSKYVVQKLRKMETNQRIYSENLINTVLMLGQLGKLNGKSKITET